MMDFATAWDAFEVGDAVEVSNGVPEPAGLLDSLEHRIWRSHNFTGAIAERVFGPPRAIVISFSTETGAEIGFSIVEGEGHSFRPNDPSPSQAREIRWQEAKAYSEIVASAGFELAGVGRIQSDPASREAIRLLVDEARDRMAAGEASWSTAFVNEANQQVPVTAEQIVAIYAALRGFLGACYAARQTARDALDAAVSGGATAAEIIALDLTAIFPGAGTP
jgi:hypothetical protein